MPDKPHSELLAHVRASLDSYFEPDWEDVAEVYKSYASLVEQNETLRQALRAIEYLSQNPLAAMGQVGYLARKALAASNPASRDSDA